MSNFFNMDNSFFSALSKICDMLFISVVWILLCLPIITAGPATTALYYVTVKVIRRERGYLFREFFSCFRMNFKRAAIVGIILVIGYIILAFDLYWAWLLNESSRRSIYVGIFIAIIFLILCFTIYVFPILSRFDMTVKQLLKAAAFMSMRHLPLTFLMAIITIASAFAIILSNLLLMFIVPALCMFAISFLMERVFKKYMPKSEGPGVETGKDEWYLE